MHVCVPLLNGDSVLADKMSWQKCGCGENKSRVEEGDVEKKNLSMKKGLENDTIVKHWDESEACSAQYQHNPVGRKAPI